MKAVTLYRPRALESALCDFDRYMDSFFGDSFLTPSDRIFSRLPSVDIREHEKGYTLEAELPGFDEKDIAIRLDSNTLTIESKKAEEKNDENEAGASGETSGGKYLIRERRVSSFTRSFKLPENADPEGITASFRNGILSLEIGKRPEAQQRVIQISRN